MKKHRRCLAIIVVALSFVLSGCGTQVYELTAAEEELIVQYAAYFVSKYNIYQKDGIAYVAAKDETEEADKSDDTTTQKPEDSEESDKSSDNMDSMEEAIGRKGSLEITYKGSTVESYIQQGSAYYVNPGAGNVLFVMKFDVKNVSEKAVELNNLTSDMSFKLKSGDIVSTHKQTFLDNDFSAYTGTIGAGETVELILIFETKSSNAEKIVSPTLQITVGGKIKNVEL